MNRPFQTAAVVAALLSVSAALACGQAGCDAPGRPGSSVSVRGYGYGFEGGDRPVTLRWAADRSVAGTAQIDTQGSFSLQVTAPDAPGLHKLLVSVGDSDPAPVEVSVPVVLPWYRMPIAAIRGLSVQTGAALGVASAAALFAAWALVSRRRRGRQLTGELSIP